MVRNTIIVLMLLVCVWPIFAQPYKDSKLPVEKRLQDLLSRMTLEEKFMQMFMVPGEVGKDSMRLKSGIFGFQVNTSIQNSDLAQQMLDYRSESTAGETATKINDIQKFFLEKSRLGIPIIAFDEGLHGLIGKGATAFPQSIGLAATWNPDLLFKVANAIGKESRSRGIRQILSPVVNLATDVRWGRTEETYGEDPFLASQMGVAYVSGIEHNGVIATPKHFAANVGDGGRDSYPFNADERYMREYIFPPFEACFKAGGARSVMTSYNSYSGVPCTANDWLLNKILKREWGFKGFVISDAGATGGANVLHFTAKNYSDATINSITGGLDVIFQTDYNHQSLFSPPFFDGSIDVKIIDEAVARVLRSKFELGLFENPYSDPDKAKIINGDSNHRALAKQAALESIVLLKNENNILPLPKAIKSIAVIGPDADEARLGGYSGPGNHKVSILTGIRNIVGENFQINYSKGCDRENTEYTCVPETSLICSIEGKTMQGLKAEYFNNVELSGDPAFIRCDQIIKFQWTLYSPDPDKLSYDFYSVRWTGKIKAPESGKFKIGVDGNDGYRLFIDGKLFIDNWQKRGRQTLLSDFTFLQNKEYDIKIEFYEPTGNAWFNLVWNVGIKNSQKAQINEAVQLAEKSDLTIMVAGIEEGEFRDRAHLNLPGLQEELIKKIAATGKPVVVVLVGGSAITMNNWIKDVDGILDVWYPGEEGGNAVAEVLFGQYNPAGRLPITFPVFEGQLPLIYNHKPTGRGDDYLNLTGQPLFPFGFGMSYTHFQYNDIKLGAERIGKNDSTWVSVNVTNTGEMAGDEVVQLYLHDELASVARPVTELKGFKRIHLKAGESKTVKFKIDTEMLSMLDLQLHKTVEPGEFRIMIGANCKDIRQRIWLTVTD